MTLRLKRFNSKSYHIIDIADVSEQFDAYVKIINEDLEPLFKGDFKWAVDIDNEDRNANKIQGVIGTVFVFEHPIYIKMINGDITWLEDLEMLEKEKTHQQIKLLTQTKRVKSLQFVANILKRWL